MDLQDVGCGCYGLDRASSGQGQVAGTCECGNNPSDSIKCGELLDQLRTGWLLKKYSAPWSKTVGDIYRGADKSLARPTCPCILFDVENISFDASLVMYINSTNIPPIMIINRIY